jgi:hypothetical protein
LDKDYRRIPDGLAGLTKEMERKYRYVAGVVDSLCPGYRICVPLDCARLSDPEKIETDIGQLKIILNIKLGGR